MTDVPLDKLDTDPELVDIAEENDEDKGSLYDPGTPSREIVIEYVFCSYKEGVDENPAAGTFIEEEPTIQRKKIRTKKPYKSAKPSKTAKTDTSKENPVQTKSSAKVQGVASKILIERADQVNRLALLQRRHRENADFYKTVKEGFHPSQYGDTYKDHQKT